MASETKHVEIPEVVLRRIGISRGGQRLMWNFEGSWVLALKL